MIKKLLAALACAALLFVTTPAAAQTALNCQDTLEELIAGELNIGNLLVKQYAEADLRSYNALPPPTAFTRIAIIYSPLTLERFGEKFFLVLSESSDGCIYMQIINEETFDLTIDHIEGRS